MKKIFYVLLLTAITLQGQTTGVNKLKIASNPEKTTAPRVLVQETNGDVGYVAKSSLATDISGKVDKVAGKGLSTEDYTTVEKTKLSGIASGAEVNVNADWNAISGDAQILNKPTIPSIAGLATETFVNNGLSTKENTITTGTTSQYYRGDKSWQTLNKAAVGLGNVDNTSDAAKPVSTATQTALNLKEDKSNKNIANGYAGLGADGKLISNQLPAIAITDTYVVNTQASMLALTAETGDVAIRTDLNKSFILQGATASVLANWQELLSPTGGATSVFGRTGSVVANAGDYNTSQVTENTNLYYTDARVNANANVAANSAARHNPVTIGTANGLSLSTQALSLGLASTSTTGALSSTDWNTFNGKQNALGFTPYNSTNPAGYITTTGRAFPKKSDGTNVNFILSGMFALTDSPSTVLGTANGTDVYNYNTSGLNVNYANSAGSLSSMNISQFTNNSGYLTGVSWAQVSSKPAFATVATSGNYNDLSNRPTIPTNTNQLTNGAGFITGSYLPLSGGTVSGNITANAFFASSDRRLKNIISRSGDMIEFTWKDKRDNKTHFGYVAQEVRKKMPEQVNRDEQGYMSVNYIEVLVAKVNALELEVQALKEKLK